MNSKERKLGDINREVGKLKGLLKGSKKLANIRKESHLLKSSILFKSNIYQV